MSLAPVSKRIHVPLPPDGAFALFTERIDSWWPVDTHSIFGRAATAFFEATAGGRIGERDPSGREELWGTVREVERPGRLRFTWHPGRDAATAQVVEVRFTPAGTGAAVDLVHGGWDALGDRAAELRESYETGWDHVLEQFGRIACR